MFNRTTALPSPASASPRPGMRTAGDGEVSHSVELTAWGVRR